MQNEILFRGADHQLRSISARTGDVVVVTFASFTDDPSLDRPGFGQHFFHGRGIDGLYITNRRNDWYQGAEVPALLAAIRRATRDYRRVIAYGSSMGGYAAIRHAHAVGANTVVAIAPQYSVDPAVFPREDRWHEARSIDYAVERRAPITPFGETIVLYDPCEKLDRAHVERIGAEIALTRVGIPHAGHVSGVYLNEIDMLSTLLEAVLEERFDAGAFTATARSRRRDSAKYFAVLSERCVASHPAWALSLARRAARMRPFDAGHLHNLAQRLWESGEHAEAVEFERRAAAADPHCALYGKLTGIFLIRMRLFAEAASVLRDLVERHPDMADFHHLLATALAGGDDLPGAIESERTAVRLDPAQTVYRRDLKALLRRAAPAEVEPASSVPTVRTAPNSILRRLLAAGMRRPMPSRR